MSEELPNPYHDEIKEPTIAVTRGLGWVLAVVFIAIIALPPILRNIQAEWKPAVEFFRTPSPEAQNLLANKRVADPRISRETPNFIDHREAWESNLEDAPFSNPPRRVAQQLLTTFFREGNRKTVIGKYGRMYYRPAIDSLTGYGPLKPEPESVAKDPTRPPWSGPREAIIEFAAQLEEFDVELMLVPIPVKPMIYPDNLAQTGAPLRHPDADEFYAQLQEAGVDVVDFADDFAGARRYPMFLFRDTHWTPQGLERAAEIISKRVKAKGWYAGLETRTFESTPVQVDHVGDLVDKLDLALEWYAPERVEIQQLLAPEIHDRESPVVLLGDSFTNIYSAKEMGWGERGGFAEHLSAKLGISIDTIAQNGQASSGVRNTLANRQGSASEMREKKKLVIWAIAARDLFLSETVARETEVEWKSVAFNDVEPRTLPQGGVVIEGEMVERSNAPSPADAPYPSVIYAAKYRVLKTIKGADIGEEEIVVYHWGYRNRETQPSSRFKPGDRHTLTLIPFEPASHSQGARQFDNIDEIFLYQPFWSKEANSIE